MSPYERDVTRGDPDHPRDRARRAGDAAALRLRHPRSRLRGDQRDDACPRSRRRCAKRSRLTSRGSSSSRSTVDPLAGAERPADHHASTIASAAPTRSTISSIPSSTREGGGAMTRPLRLDGSAANRRSTRRCSAAPRRCWRRRQRPCPPGEVASAIIGVAARIGEEVTRRLDRVPDKQADNFYRRDGDRPRSGPAGAGAGRVQARRPGARPTWSRRPRHG